MELDIESSDYDSFVTYKEKSALSTAIIFYKQSRIVETITG